MSSLVRYYDSDEEQDDFLDAASQPVEPVSMPSLGKRQENTIRASSRISLGFTSLPAPKNTKRRRLPTVSESEDFETSNNISAPSDANGDGPPRIFDENGIEQIRDEIRIETTSHQVAEAPKPLIDDEIQGPSAIASNEPAPLPHIVFRGRVVPPPPGLVPPPGLKLNGDVDISRPGIMKELPIDHSWVAGLRKGNIMELSQDDLRRFELSRPVDPLGATRGELIQSEIAAGLWTSKQGQLLSTAQATFNQSRRHHINSMATTAALMEESIRQQASVGQDRRRQAKAKYGW